MYVESLMSGYTERADELKEFIVDRMTQANFLLIEVYVMNDDLAPVAYEINKLIGEYDFPLLVLQDVYGRLQSNDDPGYHMQQLRYLRNLVAAGHVVRKVD